MASEKHWNSSQFKLNKGNLQWKKFDEVRNDKIDIDKKKVQSLFEVGLQKENLTNQKYQVNKKIKRINTYSKHWAVNENLTSGKHRDSIQIEKRNRKNNEIFARKTLKAKEQNLWNGK